MDVSIAEAKNRLAKLIRAFEDGEKVVITRERRQVRLGGMKDRIQLLRGWDRPVDLDRFLKGKL